MRVALAGLGIMGYRIAANLAKAGKLHVVYNRTVSKAERFSKEYGVEYVKNPLELIKSADFLITVLSDDEAVSSFLSPLIRYSKDKIIVDMSTISPSTSVSLAKEIFNNDGVMFDAPILGTSVHVEQKTITVLVGGPKDKFELVREVLKETASSVLYMGNNGSALYAKLVNNILAGIYVAALSEVYAFGISSGLDPEDILRILTKYSSSRAPIGELKLPKMIKGDYSTQFATKHMAKDLEIAVREAQKVKALHPLTSLTLQLYRIAEGLGYSEDDLSAILEVYKRASRNIPKS